MRGRKAPGVVSVIPADDSTGLGMTNQVLFQQIADGNRFVFLWLLINVFTMDNAITLNIQ